MTTISGWTMPSMLGLPDAIPADVNSVGRWYYPKPAETSWADVSLVEQLAAIAKLEANWDGYGAEPVEPSALRTAERLLPQLRPIPDLISPSATGTVVIEWETSLGRANLELGRTTFSFYAAPRIGEPIFLAGDAREEDAEELNFALAAIVSGPSPRDLSGSSWRSGIALLD